MCSLNLQDRLIATGKGALMWKWYEDERPGTRYDNMWPDTSHPKSKRYVVQTAASIIERCVLMVTDPGDLVLDPTCGSGATAEVAEEWGRRWITCDVQRVSVAVARKHLMARSYDWHQIVGDSDSPSNGFMVESMPKVSAATLAYHQLHDPKHQIDLVDRTKKDKQRIRVCSPFTVESQSPYRYVPVGDESAVPGAGPPSGPGDALSEADDHDREGVLDALLRTPVCDSDSREMFRVASVTELPAGDRHSWLVTHVADCRERGRDTGFRAAVMVAAPDAAVNLDVAQRSVVEMRRQGVEAEDLLLVGYEFAPNIPDRFQGVRVHQVAADKGLQISETIKGGEEGGTFTILSDLVTELAVVRDHDRRPVTAEVKTEDGTVTRRPLVTVELLGWDTYNPGTGAVRSGTAPDELDAWMIDTNHDGLSFETRHVYFPSGLANERGFRALAKSLRRGKRDQDAEDALWSLTSQPFPAPDPGKVIAVKAITKTGAEIAGLITDGW